MSAFTEWIDYLFTYFIGLAVSLFDSTLGPYFDFQQIQQALSTLGNVLSSVANIVPIYEVISIWVGGLVAQCSIRLIRWAIGFIPTIEG